MKRVLAALLCAVFFIQLCACKSKDDNTEISSSSDTSAVSSNQAELSEVEKKFNALTLTPDYYLSVSSDTDITDMFSTSFLENTYDFEINKSNAEKLLKDNINKIIDGKVTNCEKAAACYDWLIQNIDYHDYGFSNWVSLIVIFSDHQGNPFDFAYAYYAMLRYIGIDAKLMKGQRSLETGGNSMHSWVTVDIDGVTYFFDPFTDNNNADLKETATCHDCFMKTEEEVGYRYVYNASDIKNQ